MLKGQFLTKNTPIMRKDVRIEAKGRVFEPIGVAVHQAYSTPHASVFTASLLPGAPHPPKRGEDARAQESRQRRRWGGSHQTRLREHGPLEGEGHPQHQAVRAPRRREAVVLVELLQQRLRRTHHARTPSHRTLRRARTRRRGEEHDGARNPHTRCDAVRRTTAR